MGPIWGRQDPGGPCVGPMNFVIWENVINGHWSIYQRHIRKSLTEGNGSLSVRINGEVLFKGEQIDHQHSVCWQKRVGRCSYHGTKAAGKLNSWQNHRCRCVLEKIFCMNYFVLKCSFFFVLNAQSIWELTDSWVKSSTEILEFWKQCSCYSDMDSCKGMKCMCPCEILHS